MKLSKLVALLNDLQKQHGDIWILPIAKDEPEMKVYPREPRIKVVGDKNGSPMAVIG